MTVVDMFFTWGQHLLYAFWNVYDWFANVDLKERLVSGLTEFIGGIDITGITDRFIEKYIYRAVSYLFQDMDSFTVFDLLFSRWGLIALTSISLFVLVKRAIF